MPAKKTKKSAKKNKKLPIRSIRRPKGLYILAGVLILLCVWWTLSPTAKVDLPQPGELIEGQAEPANAYQSLNLRIAAKATYLSSKIAVTDNLGISNGVNHQIVRFKVAKDSLNEYGLMTLPNTPAPADGYPVLILCHGYYNPLYYATEKSYLGDMEFYSRAGFAVIKPDYRGQGLSLAEGRPEGAYYSMAYNTDVISLIAAVKQTGYLNKDNINLWGHSMGAYIALRAAVLSPDVKNVILLSGPVGNIQDMYATYVAISDTNNSVAAGIRADQLARHGTPLTNPSFWNDTSPINFLDKSRAFIQIHVGSSDELVPPQFSAELDAALKDINKDHEYFVYTDGKHGLLPERNKVWAQSLRRLEQKS
jgi:uncharacterized protein